MPRETLADKLAKHFQAHPNTWLDARGLLSVAGFGGWRTRVSDLRRQPYRMVIENRQRRENGYTVSEYRWVPDREESAA